MTTSIAFILKQQAGAVDEFVNACSQAELPEADELAGYVFLHVEGAEVLREAYLCNALKLGRPVFTILRELFTLKTPLGNSQFKVSPQSSNDIRCDLYVLAHGESPISERCKDMLAELECDRREAGRPDDELRHPNPTAEMPWTDVLTAIAAS